MDVETGSRNVRLEQMCLVLRPAGTSRRELIGQLRPTDHDVAAQLHVQAVAKMLLQFGAVPSVIIMAGMSTVPPGVPIAIGGPPSLLTTITARAPASFARRILSRKKQTPRSIRAMLPVERE